MNRVVITLPSDLHQRIKANAEERGLSMAGLVRHYLEEELTPEDTAKARGVAEEQALYVAAPAILDKDIDMNRTIISLPMELHRRIKAIAAAQGVSISSMIRQIVERRAPQERRLPRGLGMFASGRTDTAALAGEIRYEPRSWR